MTDIQLCYMEAKALLPGISKKKLQELVSSGEVSAEIPGKGKSIENAVFSNNSVCEYAIKNGLWNL